MRFAYVHKVCGGVVFYRDIPFVPTEKLSSRGVTWPDSAAAQPGEQIQCGTCGAHLYPMSELFDVVEVADA